MTSLLGLVLLASSCLCAQLRNANLNAAVPLTLLKAPPPPEGATPHPPQVNGTIAAGSNATFPSFSSYLYVPAGFYDIRLADPSGGDVSDIVLIELMHATAYSVACIPPATPDADYACDVRVVMDMSNASDSSALTSSFLRLVNAMALNASLAGQSAECFKCPPLPIAEVNSFDLTDYLALGDGGGNDNLRGLVNSYPLTLHVAASNGSTLRVALDCGVRAAYTLALFLDQRGALSYLVATDAQGEDDKLPLFVLFLSFLTFIF
jgi:hypothetical protein